MITHINHSISLNPKITKWTSKLLFTIIDQGFFSGSNFLVSLLLARFVDPATYGVFSVTYSVFLFIAGIYSSLVLEPINILGPKYHDQDLILYKLRLIKLHLNVALVFLLLGFLEFLFSLFFNIQSEYIRVSFWAFLSIPFIMFFWLARQCSYLEAKPKVAALGSLIYSFLYLGGGASLVFLKNIQISYIFIIMSFAGIIGGIVVFIKLGINSSILINSPAGFFSGLFAENWNFGRWILFASIAYGISTLIYSPLIGVTLGAEQAGIFRSMQNLFLPFNQAVTATILLMTPTLSRIKIRANSKDYRKHMLLYGSLLLIFTILYCGLIQLFGYKIVNIIYNKVEYDKNIWIIPFLGISTIITTIISCLGMIFRVNEKTSVIFWGKIISALAVVFICIPIVIKFQMRGVLLGLNTSLIIEMFVLLVIGAIYRNKNANEI